MKKFFLFAFAAILLAGCNSSTELEGISLNKNSLQIEKGESYTLVVLYEPESAAEMAPQVYWESSHSKVVSVDENGKITALAEGYSDITAHCGKFEAICKVEVVKGEEIPIEDMFIDISTTEINAEATGGTFKIDITSNIPWDVYSAWSWIKVTPERGEGNGTVTVEIEPNGYSKTDEVSIFISGRYSDGTGLIKEHECKISRKGIETLPESKYVAKPFTVEKGKTIYFSFGILQYQPETGKCRFADHQYDVMGTENNKINKENFHGWVDLFCWGTGNNPKFTSDNYNDFQVFTDWGVNKIENGGNEANLWRTMTRREWEYMFDIRDNAEKLRGAAMVNDVCGYIFLPDDWVIPEGLKFTADGINCRENDYTLITWQKMEAAGAVFLPCAGVSNTMVGATDNECIYWSSTPRTTGSEYDMDYAIAFHFRHESFAAISEQFRTGRAAVRLVQDVE